LLAAYAAGKSHLVWAKTEPTAVMLKRQMSALRIMLSPGKTKMKEEQA
jgi:hypothetical protein